MTDIWQHLRGPAHFTFPYHAPPSRLLSLVNANRGTVSRSYSSAVWTSFFFRSHFASVHTLLLSSYPLFICLIIIFAFHVRKCLGIHSCMSSTLPIAMLNGTCFFSDRAIQVHKENPVRDGKNTTRYSKPVPLN